MKSEVLERRVPPPAGRRDGKLIRERFDMARSLLETQLTAPETHNDIGFYRAMNELQRKCPDLSASEIEALVSAVLRSLRNPAG